MDKLLEQLVERLRRSFGDRLVSVVLYGSAASEEYQSGYSDLNILCILTHVAAKELADAEDLFRWWRGEGNPAPLLMSEAELGHATDCFAAEFHDIQRHHRILTGRDVVSGLVIEDSFYRAQVEHDLRAKLLRLRQKASGILSEDDHLLRLLVDSVSTFCVLFRHALVLHGVPAPATKRDVLEHVRERFGVDPSPFASLLDIRDRRVRVREVQPVGLLGGYLEGIGKVIDAVDGLDH
jgi:hypothetical protein